MRQLPFQLSTFIGSLIWCYALALAGDQLGRSLQDDPALQSYLHHMDQAVPFKRMEFVAGAGSLLSR